MEISGPGHGLQRNVHCQVHSRMSRTCRAGFSRTQATRHRESERVADDLTRQVSIVVGETRSGARECAATPDSSVDEPMCSGSGRTTQTAARVKLPEVLSYERSTRSTQARRTNPRTIAPSNWHQTAALPRIDAELNTMQNRTRFTAEIGAPGGTRTPDHQVRSLMLYPTELRTRWGCIFDELGRRCQRHNAADRTYCSVRCMQSWR